MTTNIYADSIAHALATTMSKSGGEIVEPVEVVSENEATFTVKTPDGRSMEISVMDVTE